MNMVNGGIHAARYCMTFRREMRGRFVSRMREKVGEEMYESTGIFFLRTREMQWDKAGQNNLPLRAVE